MMKKLFLTLLTFFILVLGPFHSANSKPKEIDGWVLIGSKIDLADSIEIFDYIYLNEQRIERNDNITIIDVLINGGPGMRFKDINTGEMKEKPAFYDYEKKYYYNSEIYKMVLKCDSKDKFDRNSRLVTYSNPRRYSEKMGKGIEYTDINTTPKAGLKDRIELLNGERKLPSQAYVAIKEKFPALCANFQEVLTDKEIRDRGRGK